MTQEEFNRAGDILKQISKLNQLKDDLGKVYSEHKEDVELKSVFERCVEVVNVLLEIDKKKFKEL
jgi:hypothetical protein